MDGNSPSQRPHQPLGNSPPFHLSAIVFYFSLPHLIWDGEAELLTWLIGVKRLIFTALLFRSLSFCFGFRKTLHVSIFIFLFLRSDIFSNLVDDLTCFPFLVSFHQIFPLCITIFLGFLGLLKIMYDGQSDFLTC